MEAQALQNEMLHFFSQLNDAEQQSVLNMLKTFIKSKSPVRNRTDDEFEPVTIQEYNRELEEADAEIEAGEYVAHEEVKKLFNN